MTFLNMILLQLCSGKLLCNICYLLRYWILTIYISYKLRHWVRDIGAPGRSPDRQTYNIPWNCNNVWTYPSKSFIISRNVGVMERKHYISIYPPWADIHSRQVYTIDPSWFFCHVNNFAKVGDLNLKNKRSQTQYTIYYILSIFYVHFSLFSISESFCVAITSYFFFYW